VVGGNHGHISGATWLDDGRGLAFDGSDRVRVQNATRIAGTDGFSLSVTFQTDNSTNYVESNRYPRLAGTAPSSAYRNTSGYQLALARGQILAALGNGERAVRLYGPRVDDGRKHTATVVWNGTAAQLSLDGDVVAVKQYTGTVTRQSQFALGGTTNGGGLFVGDLLDVSVNTSVPSDS
jgi:hypothetical protein